MMKNQVMQEKISAEVLSFIHGRRSLQLASIATDGTPYASYAPFAIGDECLYVLLSDIALHAINLQVNPKASVLIVEDEDSANELFARVRVNYSMDAQLLDVDTAEWHEGIDTLACRLGSRIHKLSELSDFKLFRLLPTGGRYVKGFGKAYGLAGRTLAGEDLTHMRDGHKKRQSA